MRRKTLILIITLLSIFIGLKIDVYAASYSDSFYVEDDVIDGISYAKVKNGVTEYRQAQFKRRISDNKIVYCIEPFVGLIENSNYNGYDSNYEKLLNMSSSDWERVSLLAYYGYGYEGHTAAKWYPITQILIWQTIDKDAEFYWTDSYKGNKVTKFTTEINEIETLVKNHNTKPSFNGKSYDMSISSTLTLEDTNKVLSSYEVKSSGDVDVEISNNNLIISSNDEAKDINITLVKEDKSYDTPPIIYVSDIYQNLLVVGSYTSVTSNLNITISSGSLKITKVDSETETIIPQGEASLIGAVYNLYDNNYNLIDELIIGEDNTASLDNLPYGDYILKEKESGIGYTLDNNEYNFTIDQNSQDIELYLSNDVIKSKIKFYKYLRGKNITSVEANITFQIIDSSGNIYKEVVTNEYGIIEFELPYGTYTIKQLNTTDGYSMIDDFTIMIDENSAYIIEYYLNDLEIPDTSENINYYMYSFSFLSIIIFLLYGYRRVKINH